MTINSTARGRDRYALVAILLHWTIAAAILLQVSLAGRMDGPRTPEMFAVTQLHKSVGITILLLSLARLAWRLMNPPPPLPAGMARWEKALAHTVHVGLYGIMIGMPLTGWLMVSASKLSLPTYLYGIVPWPDLPGLAQLAPAAKKVWFEIGHDGHHLLEKVLYGLVALHVAGALKHQLFSRDEPVLGRMAPGARSGRWLEPRLLAILLGVVAVGAFGKIVHPPLPPMAAAPAAPAAPAPAAQSLPVAEPSPPPATAEPAGAFRWSVAPGSTVGFTTSWGGQKIEGRFERFTAAIVFGPEALEKSKVAVRIDLSSANTGDAQRDASLPSGDWFDAANHPQAEFTATKFEKLAGDRYLAHGTLKLRGVDRPLDLPFSLKIEGDTARARGVTTLDRTAFGVGQGEWAKTDQIPAKVTVSVDLKARRR